MSKLYKQVSSFAFFLGCFAAVFNVESSLPVFAWGAFVTYLGETDV